LYFDGSSSYLQIAAPSNMICDWTKDFTLEYWINPTSFGSGANGHSNVLGNVNDTGTGEYWTFGPISTGAVRFYYYNGSQNTITSTTTIPTGQWTHLAISVDNTGWGRIFINGVLFFSNGFNPGAQYGSGIAFSIGKCAGSSFTGYIDDLRITRYARYLGNFQPPTSQLQDQ